MKISLAKTGAKMTAVIKPVEEEDFRFLTKKRFSFSWRHFKGSYGIFKLCLKGEDDILGVMAMEDFPEDKRIEIKLLASSLENVGQGKIYDGIAGCLIAYACREAVKRYAYDACVSLIPKTILKPKYISKYGMQNAGRHVFLEGQSLINLIKKYLP